MASTEVTCACPAMAASALVEVFLDPLGFAQKVGGVLAGKLDEILERFYCLPEFLGEFFVLLVLPGIAQGAEAGVKEDHAVFEIAIESLEFLGKPPHLFRIHDCLGHSFSLSLGLTYRVFRNIPALGSLCEPLI